MAALQGTRPSMSGMRAIGQDGGAPGYRQLQNLSLGGVAATYKEVILPKKYRPAKPGEVSTYQGAGIVPICRRDQQVLILLQQPQKGKKMGVRFWDFGGRKLNKSEFTSRAACRKFAKQTYGIFGVNADWEDPAVLDNVGELYHDLANLPLMLNASQEWAQTQLLDDCQKIFYNDQHEYHIYFLNVPFVPTEVLDSASSIVDEGKRQFAWLTPEDFMEEALAPRLHVDTLMRQIAVLNQEVWVIDDSQYGHDLAKSTATFDTLVE